MAVKDNVINGMWARWREIFWASHLEATVSAREGSVRGSPRRVRRTRPLSVTVCHEVVVDEDDCGLRREDQLKVWLGVKCCWWGS